jgi:spermidine/putrescine transport system permease protein
MPMTDATSSLPDKNAAPSLPVEEADVPLLPAGGWCAVPILFLLLVGFLAPLLAVTAISFAEPRTFGVFSTFTLANYREIFDPANTVWMSFAWSFGFAAVTVLVLVAATYPIAIGLVRVFGKWAPLISILFVFPLFISENVRLYGWVLFFFKDGFLDGTLQLLHASGPDVLFKPGIILFGMIYTYLPFMLFPVVLGLSLVPSDVIYAARDLGASRFQTWWEVELPLAMPGMLIGMLLTFVLGAGAVSESKIVGGQAVIVVPHDIEIAFTYAQNWPLGAALAVILTVIIGTVTMFALSRLDLDRILGRR